MFARVLIQECKPGTVEMLTRKVEETLIGPVRGIPGFVSYKVLKLDDRSLIAMGFFETREAAREMETLGAEWRKQYGKGAILSARPYIGEILLDAGPVEADVHLSD